MTTKLIIQNDSMSTGDVVVRYANVCFVNDPRLVAGNISSAKELRLLPGDPAVTIGITDYSLISITEEWPTKKPMPADAANFCKHGIGVAYRCQDCGDVPADQRQGVHAVKYDTAAGAYIAPKNVPVPEGSEH